MRRFVPTEGQRIAFNAVSWVAFITALPVIGFAGFSLFALTQERGGWHPAPAEAVIIPLCWLGAVLLPLCGWRLRSAADGNSARPVFGRFASGVGMASLILIGLIVWLAMPKHPDSILTGSIIDATTGKPLEQATVTLSRSDESEALRQARTDLRGRYRLRWPEDTDLLYWRDGVRHGVDLVFTASAPGYEGRSIPLSQIPPSRARITGRSVSTCTARLTRTRQLSVRSLIPRLRTCPTTAGPIILR